MLLFSLSTIFLCAVIGMVHPFKILSQNYFRLASEAVILTVMDLFLIVSDPSLSGEAKSYLGIAMVLIVSLYFAIFIGSLVITSISHGIRYV